MPSQIAIANRALSKLGEARITTLEADLKAARAIAAAFDIVRDDELRAHGWSFAMKRAQLAADVTAPAFGHRWAYTLPVDAVRIWTLGEWYWTGPDLSDFRNAGDGAYTVEGRKILTSEGRPSTIVPGAAPALNLRYIAQIPDTTQWDSNFVEAFATRLAIEVCEELTQSASKKSALWAEYEQAIRRARRANAIELPPEYIADDSWIASRFR